MHSLSGVAAKHRFVIGAEADDALLRFDARARAVDAGRGRDRNHQLHDWHDRATQGRAAHAPQLVGQLGDLRLATGVSDRDVYLHTLPMFHCNGWGMPYAVPAWAAHTSCCARSTAPRSCAASTSTA